VKYYLYIAFRNLWRNQRRTLFNIIAISFGLFCLIVFQALKVGLHRQMYASTVNLDVGSFQIHPEGFEVGLFINDYLSNDDLVRIKDSLKRLPIKAVAPRLRTTAIAMSEKKSGSVVLTGIVPEKESLITFIKTRLIKGDYLESRDGLLVGRALLKSLGLKYGESLTLVFQDSKGFPRRVSLPVTGVYSTELSTFDRTHIYIHLKKLQALMGVNNSYSSIVLLTDRQDEAEVKEALKGSEVLKKYRVMSWDEIAPDVKQIMQLNNATMSLLIIIVFAIVAMGITNTMTTLIFERFREFGTLTAIGTPPEGIVTIVLSESALLGIIACVIGTLTGYLVCLYLRQHGVDLNQFTSANQHMAFSHVLKAYALPGDIIKADVITFLTALVAGLYPSLKAARLNPVDALRHV